MMLREWAPLEHLLSRVPPLTSLGREQQMTCVAGLSTHLALGTSTGTVFWYDRCLDTLQRLEVCPGRRVTSLRLVETTDIMLAVGGHEGELVIYQIPRPLQPGSPLAAAAPGAVQDIQQFAIPRLHSRSVSALAWSVNGQRLFSGDSGGLVACSEVDFFQHSTTSRVLVPASGHPVVALDYSLKTLMVNTAASCFLLREGKRMEVGSRARAGLYGGALLQAGVGEGGLLAVSVRPASRLWVAQAVSGRVESTLVLAEALAAHHTQIPLINPTNIVAEEATTSPLLKVAVLCEARQELVVWHGSGLHIVSLTKEAVVASCCSLRGVQDVSITDCGEIFVLESGRSLVRLADKEDRYRHGVDWRKGLTAAQGPDTVLQASVEGLGSGLVQRLQPSAKLFAAALPLQPFSQGWLDRATVARKEASPSPVEEAREASQEEASQEEASLEEASQEDGAGPESDFRRRMDRIGEMAFGSLLAQPRRVRQGRRSPRPATTDPGMGLESSLLHEEEAALGLDSKLRLLEEPSSPGQNPLEHSNLSQHNMCDDEKEKTLMKILQIDNDIGADSQVGEVPDSMNDPEVGCVDSSATEEPVSAVTNSESCGVYSRCSSQYGPSSVREPSKQPGPSLVQSSMQPGPSSAQSSLTSLKFGSNSDQTSLQYGPPSDNSNLTSSLPSLPASSLTSTSTSTSTTRNNSKETDKAAMNYQGPIIFSSTQQELMTKSKELPEEGWLEFSLPGSAGSLCDTKELLWFCDSQDRVFYSSLHLLPHTLVWQPADFPASQIASSGTVFWRLHNHSVFCLVKEEEDSAFPDPSSRWLKLCDNVASISVGQDCGWIVRLDGGLVCHKGIAREQGPSDPPRQLYTGMFLTYVLQWGGSLLGLEGGTGRLLHCSLEHLAVESAWTEVSPPSGSVSSLSLSPGGLLAVLDSQRQLQLSTDWAEDSSSSLPSWLRPLAPRSPGRPGLPASLCPPVLTCRQGRLWQASPLSSSLLLAPASLHCYTWSSLPQLSSPQARLARLWAGEREAYSGRLLLSPSPDCLLWTQIHSGRLEALALPRGERLGQLAALPQALWLLAQSGRVYIRSSQTAAGWAPLALGQLAGHTLSSLSLGRDQAWAVDTEGGSWLRLGGLEPPPSHVAPAWLRVEGEPCSLVQVASSPSGHRVWARDREGGVWVREAVYPELPCGTGWVAVSGLSASWLEVSQHSVWVLAPGGRLYRRLGLGETDWLGRAWQEVPGPRGQVVVALSAGQCDTLWALDSTGGVHQLSVTDTPLTEKQQQEEENDWTLVDQA